MSLDGAIRARMSLAKRLIRERLVVNLKHVALAVREFYPEIAAERLRRTEKFPRGFRRLVLEQRPERIYSDVSSLVRAIKRSVLEKTLKPYEGLQILRLEDDSEIDLGVSLLAVSGDHLETVVDKIPRLKPLGRLKSRIHAVARIRPEIAGTLAEVCDRKEFVSLALEMLSEGFVEQALRTLVNTLAGTNDAHGLKLVVDKSKGDIVLEAFERIITDVRGVEEFLELSGREPSDLFRLRASLGRPPKAARVKEFLLKHRDEAREIVKLEGACPRYRINAAGKYEPGIIEEAFAIPYKDVRCPVSEALKAIMRVDRKLLAKLVERSGCIALKKAVEEYGIFREALELISAKCPHAINDVIEALDAGSVKDLYGRISKNRAFASPHYVSRLANLLAEAFRGSGREDVIGLVRAMSKKAGLDEELPRLLATILGRVTAENRELFEGFDPSLLLRLVDEGLADAEAALRILAKAKSAGLYIPISTLIAASKLGVPDSELERIADGLPIHVAISLAGRLAIKRRDRRLREEFIERSSAYGFDIPDKILEELAEAYARDPEYLGFLFVTLRRRESAKLAKLVAERLRGEAREEILERISELYSRRRPCPEAVSAVAYVFEGSGNRKAVEFLRRISLDAMPIEALEALKAMRRVYKDAIDEDRFMLRFTPTLARASLSPGGEGAYGILTAIYEAIEKIAR